MVMTMMVVMMAEDTSGHDGDGNEQDYAWVVDDGADGVNAMIIISMELMVVDKMNSDDGNDADADDEYIIFFHLMTVMMDIRA